MSSSVTEEAEAGTRDQKPETGLRQLDDGGPAAFEGAAPAQVRLPPGVYLVRYRLAGKAETEALLSVPAHNTGPRTVLLDPSGLSVSRSERP